jgi:hypothetical protein
VVIVIAVTARSIVRLLKKKIAAVGFLVFLGLWIVGAVRGLTLPYPQPLPLSVASSGEESYSRAPVANNMKQLGLIETPMPLLLDGANVDKIRVHEKRAVLALGTSAFDYDTAKVHAAVESHKGEIFTYKKSGIEPTRRLVREIGVHPDKFDDLVEKLRAVGTLSGISVEQKDRTHEFRNLHSQRQTLKKHLEAINKLREGKTLSLDDALRLEQKIQDLEEKIQSLGVQFGDLLGKESYYHVHVTLTEYQPGDRGDQTYTTPQRIGHAFLWAIVWWFAVALAAGVVAATGVSVWVLRQKSDA